MQRPISGFFNLKSGVLLLFAKGKGGKTQTETLPKVMTPHTLWYTFRTNLANAGMNPKALQYIMGHSNITMTLNYYAHAAFASARAEMERLAS